MNKFFTMLLATALAALAVIAAVPFHETDSEAQKTRRETAFARVMRTRTIRCAYATWPPHFIVDPKTGEKSGIDVDVIEAIGRVSGLTIQWEDEVGIGAAPEQLRSGKQDVYCAAVWENARRAQRVETSRPIDYMPLYAYVREEDKRFDNDAAALNNENVSISLIDGSAQKALADGSFPKAKQHSLPMDMDATQSLLAVSAGKADVVFSDAAVIADYNAHNPERKLRRAAGSQPLRIYGDVFMVAKGETELRDLLNAAITELHNDGTIGRILDVYATEPGAFLRVAAPYRAAQ